MSIYHKCYMSLRNFPGNVQYVECRKRCETCGQWWRIKGFYGGGQQAQRVSAYYPNLKLWRWRRKNKRLVK